MVDRIFKFLIIFIAGGFLLSIIPIILYLFAFQPLKLRSAISKYPIGAYVIVNKLSYKLGPHKAGDVIAFKSLRNPDIDEVGIIDKIEQEIIFVNNSSLPLSKFDIVGKISFCYSSCE